MPARRQSLEPLKDVLFEHAPEFMRRTGQENNNRVAILIVDVKKLSRRRTAFVVQHVGPVNDVALALVVF